MSTFNNLDAEIKKKDIIYLSDDVVLKDLTERSNFREGIKISSDNIVIDGNGHTIDAKGKIRIFNISGNNITLKNINFKNGSTKKFGGAIRNKGCCKIIDCTFENNFAKKGGHDISNGSKICISNCKFSHSNSIHSKGPIYTLENEVEDLKPFVSNDNLIKHIIVTCNVSFNVIDEDEFKSLSGATVSIAGKTAVTNENGNCSFEEIKEGINEVTVSANGFKNFKTSVDVSSDNADFLFKLSKITHNVSFNVINDDENKSLSGATVSIAGKTAVSNEYGNCSFEGIKNGINEVNVSANGFENFETSVDVSSDNTHFSLIISRIAHDVLFSVVGDENEPVECALVSICGKTGTTNENGECTVKGVNGGSNKIKVSAEGYKHLLCKVNVSSDNTNCSVLLTKVGIEEYHHLAKRPFQSYSGDESYVFTSYAHNDAIEVFQDLKRFHDLGLKIWYDEGITSGAGWQEEVENAIVNSSIFIVFISNSSVESRNVRNEIFLAIKEDIPIIPIYLEETNLKYGLNLELSAVQSILKYALSDEEYLRLCRRDFLGIGIEIKENQT